MFVNRTARRSIATALRIISDQHAQVGQACNDGLQRNGRCRVEFITASKFQFSISETIFEMLIREHYLIILVVPVQCVHSGYRRSTHYTLCIINIRQIFGNFSLVIVPSI